VIKEKAVHQADSFLFYLFIQSDMSWCRGSRGIEELTCAPARGRRVVGIILVDFPPGVAVGINRPVDDVGCLAGLQDAQGIAVGSRSVAQLDVLSSFHPAVNANRAKEGGWQWGREEAWR
jgi:hypothetical protein